MYKIIITTIAVFISAAAAAETVQDVNKNVVIRQPYQIEVCADKAVSGDKTSDTLKGALVGGAIGNNITKNLDNGAAVGALLGGILAHNASKAVGGTKTVCNVETRYNEQIEQRYVYSIVTFMYEGREYNLQFVK